MWEQKEPSSYTHIHPCPRLSTNSSIVPITREGLSQLECLSLLLCNLKMLCSEQQSRHAITTAIQNQPLVDFLPCCCLPLNSQRASLTVDREWLLMSPEQSSVNRQAWTNYPYPHFVTVSCHSFHQNLSSPPSKYSTGFKLRERCLWRLAV